MESDIKGTTYQSLNSVLFSPTVLLCKMFGKLTNTLCFLPFLSFIFFLFPAIIRIKDGTGTIFFHIRFHAWLCIALIYHTWNFPLLKLNMIVEVSVLHLGMFSAHVRTLNTVFLPAIYSARGHQDVLFNRHICRHARGVHWSSSERMNYLLLSSSLTLHTRLSLNMI